MGEKRGQLTIFIILGILVVGLVILFFFLYGGTEKVSQIIGREENPESFMQSCLEDRVRDGISLISKQGGSANNQLNISFQLEDEEEPVDISYLCYSMQKGFPCSNQQTPLIPHVEDEISEYVEDDAESCFNDFISSLESQGYSINEENYGGVGVNIEPGRAIVNLDVEISATASGSTSRYEEFRILIGTKTYELVNLANRIVNGESRSCGFHHDIYQVINPEFNIEKITTTDSSEIYVLEHENGEEFRMAVRSCTSSGGVI